MTGSKKVRTYTRECHLVEEANRGWLMLIVVGCKCLPRSTGSIVCRPGGRVFRAGFVRSRQRPSGIAVPKKDCRRARTPYSLSVIVAHDPRGGGVDVAGRFMFSLAHVPPLWEGVAARSIRFPTDTTI